MSTMRKIALSLALAGAPLGAQAGTGSIDPDTGQLDFEVNFRYPPTAQQLTDAKDALTQMSEILCDATDGQVRVGDIRLTAGAAGEEAAAFWYQSVDGRSGGSMFTDGSSLKTKGAHLDIYLGAQTQADVLAHEMGHHAFGLGESYDEQHTQGRCGIGFGFDPGTEDEQNHSLMQQLGYVQCVGGLDDGDRCLRDADCSTNDCRAVLQSELSVDANHDLVQGDSLVCPAPAATANLTLGGQWPQAAVIQPLDPTDWDTAFATWQFARATTVVDDNGAVASQVVLFANHTAPLQWTVIAAVDGFDIGATPGTMQVLDQWVLSFAAGGALTGVDETPPVLDIPNLASGGSDLVIAMQFTATSPNTWNPSADILADGVVVCTEPNCADWWNTGSQRWESTQQSQIHDGDSDWATLVENYGFLVMPAGLPVAAAPADCNNPPDFDEKLEGTDQAMLVIDRSGSMAWSSDPAEDEICGNGADDDGDGTIDESSCADPRMVFAQAGAHAYIELQVAQGLDVGLVAFDDVAGVVRALAPLNAANIGAFHADIDSLVPGNSTAIGDGLLEALAEFALNGDDAKSQTAFLLSDGENNAGTDPEEAAQTLDDAGVRVFTLPAGADVDEALLADIAKETGGDNLGQAKVDELPAVYAELAVRQGGEALVVPRTRFTMERSARPQNHGDLEEVQPFVDFDIPVELGAEGLTVFLSGANARLDTWHTGFELWGPDGSYLTKSSPLVSAGDGWYFVRIPDPVPGNWTFRALPIAPGEQETVLLAHVANPGPDLFGDAHPVLASVSAPVRLSAQPSFVTSIEGDVSIGARVRRPDGSVVSLELAQDPQTGAWQTAFDAYAGQGLYEVTLDLDVGLARPAAGESVFEGPLRPDVDVPRFQRSTSTTFVVIDGPDPSDDPDHRDVIDLESEARRLLCTRSDARAYDLLRDAEALLRRLLEDREAPRALQTALAYTQRALGYERYGARACHRAGYYLDRALQALQSI